ncbi:MAG: hypothetical protein KGO52_05645 [Nitrospirota bacterium]|nr:hypothetical protein [Nitrospirota bacterium]
MKRFSAGLLVGTVGLALLVTLIGQIPTTGLEGVDDRMIVHRMPLWEKAAKFYLRHRQFQRWAEEAAGGETDPQRRVLRLMEWTRSQVKPIPSGLPLVDDHISHIVLRHYGNDGQLSEVFTALTTYTGNEGRWEAYSPPGASARAALCFIESEGKWWVFDVWNDGWFETPSGQIATIEDFKHPEQLRRRGQAPELLGGLPYINYFQDVEGVFVRSFSRASGQMPWHRLLMVIGLEPEDGPGAYPRPRNP